MPNLKLPDPQSNRPDRSAQYAFYIIATIWGLGLTCTLLRALSPFVWVLPALVGAWVWQRRSLAQQTQQAHLQSVFYQLLQAGRGKITLLELAMAAQVSALVARSFLDLKAQEFAAQFDVSEAGEIIYMFAVQSHEFTPSLAPLIETQTQEVQKGAQKIQRSLTQAELARRLGVSASTLSRKKLSPDLTEWSRDRDPEGVSWAYLIQAQRFLSLDEKL
jgi:DNA-binding transcriptional regulator YiaG